MPPTVFSVAQITISRGRFSSGFPMKMITRKSCEGSSWPEFDCTAFYNEFRQNIRKAVTALENCPDIVEHLEEHEQGFNQPGYEPWPSYRVRREGAYVESSDADSSGGGSPSKKRARAHMQASGSGGNVGIDETIDLEAEVDSPYNPLACTTTVFHDGYPQPSIAAKHPPPEPKSRVWVQMHYN